VSAIRAALDAFAVTLSDAAHHGEKIAQRSLLLARARAELAAKDKALEIADGLASSVCRAYSAGLVSGNIRDQATAYRAARGAK
jgi:hypothetical protein